MIIIETERLLFRSLTFDDVDDLAALYADPEVMYYFDGPRSREQAIEQIECSRQWYDRVGFHFWATIHKEEDRFIGRCGLLPQIIEDRQEYEVAYMIARNHWGEGLGIEAARAIKQYAFEVQSFPRVVSIIDSRNRASIRVAEKNGMRYIKDVLCDGYVDGLYMVERDNSSASLDPLCSREWH